MVKINTRDFGEIEVAEERIFDFPNGVFAFEDAKQFALISPLGDDVYPMWLQATGDITPCFIVFDPLTIDSSFQYALDNSEKKLIKLNSDSSVKLLAIAKVPEDYRLTTVNMKSPIVINTDDRLAVQVILPHDYPFRLPIYENEKSKAGTS